MDALPGEKPPPESTDLEGWRKAIAEGHLPAFRLEALVAALQDLGPSVDAKVRNALAKHLSHSMLRMLRKHVGFNHRNQGEDIIYRVHQNGCQGCCGSRFKAISETAAALDKEIAHAGKHARLGNCEVGDTPEFRTFGPAQACEMSLVAWLNSVRTHLRFSV